MIYTRHGAPVQLISAEMRMVDFDVGDIRTHRLPIWYCKAKLTGTYPDGSGKVGTLVADGDWFQAGTELRADDGWSEIERACKRADHTSNALSPF